ncbi:MAG: VWA domain-containing protein [Candidatus Acidiferrum sp.]|jgi:VWFA-related protein
MNAPPGISARRRLLPRLALALLAPFCSAAQTPEGPISPRPGAAIQQPPAQAGIKVQATLVNTPVVVHNNKGEMITDLEVKDFQITENGVPQRITHFDLGSDPIAMVVLVENSSRVAPLLPEIRKTGILLTQTVLGPAGQAALLAFNDEIDKLQEFTADNELLESNIAQLPAGTSGAKLYDAMAVGVEMLSGPAPLAKETPATRRILLILAEAMDLGSTAKLSQVLRRAQLANITIYSVGLSTTRSELNSKPEGDNRIQTTPPGTFGRPPIPGTAQTPETEEARDGVNLSGAAVWTMQHAKNQIENQALEEAAVATGGAHLSTFKDRSIEKALDAIGAELHAQYNLSYSPSDGSSSGYHDISVTVKRKDVQVRFRPGYYLP